MVKKIKNRGDDVSAAEQVDQTDEQDTDQYAEQAKDLAGFLKAKPDAKFAEVYSRFLTHMLDSIREENADTRADVDNLYDQMDPPAIELLNKVTTVIASFEIFTNKLMTAAGYLKTDPKDPDKQVFSETFPFQKEFAEVGALMADLMEDVADARLELEEGDDDEDEDEDEDANGTDEN